MKKTIIILCILLFGVILGVAGTITYNNFDTIKSKILNIIKKDEPKKPVITPDPEEPKEPEIILYKEDILNGADPELTDQMITIIYDEENSTWIKASIEEKWYSYEELMWANVVIPKPEYLEKYQSADANTPINEDEIYAYFVWVPRFEYKLFNVNNEKVEEQMIEINFVNKDTEKKITIENGLFYTHPAFTANYEDEFYELNGFWIAKFEPSLNESIVEIKPGKHTLVNINYADMWKYATEIKYDYNLSIDSRIITNMEWGAIAYLSYSKYSKLNNPDYEGNNKKIFLNNAMGNSTSWNNVTTGCSGAVTSGAGKATCPYNYDVKYYGTGASSTGTIYGIYDLAGGSWECTFSVVGTSFPIKDNFGGYKGTLPDNIRYFTFYEGSNDMYNYKRGQIGDATRETLSKNIAQKSWQGNLAYFAVNADPWIKRGGTFRGGSYSGLFDYGITDARARGDKTFRTILSKY